LTPSTPNCDDRAAARRFGSPFESGRNEAVNANANVDVDVDEDVGEDENAEVNASLPDLAGRAQFRVTEHPILGPLPDGVNVTITLDGVPIAAREGEPIAAALLANGIRVFRTTSRSGERRGYFCGIGRCPDCAMIVDGEPNVRTCQTPVRDGMRVETQKGLGHLRSRDA
jgi:hypothetical protein